MLMELKGVNGQLELYQDKVILKRKGAVAKLTQGFFKGDKTIYIKQITGIQVKPGSAFTNGYIQFTISGGNESTRGILKATQDENSLMFEKKNNDLVAEIKMKIEEIMGSNETKNYSSSSADEILKYKELLDMGVITKDDFEAKKKQLLNI